MKVNKYNEVKVDQTLVHVPKGGNYSPLQMILTWDQLKIVSPNNEEFYELIAQDKLPSDNNPYEVDWSKYDSLAPREEAVN